MIKNKLTLLISSCEKFSDLWDINTYLLNKYWKNREIRSLLLTDHPTDFNMEGIEIIFPKSFLEFSKRIKFALDIIDTEYVLFTLDDYLLINHVDEKAIKSIIDTMDKEKLDYVRLYKYPKSRKIKKIKSNNALNLLTYDKRYDVNLYPGIWRKSSLEKIILDKDKNAWELEVLLTEFAKSNNYRSALSKIEVFPILDAVRKGAFLRKSKKYILKSGHYTGNRSIISLKEELKLLSMRTINTYFPDSVRRLLKKFLIKKGNKFYSND